MQRAHDSASEDADLMGQDVEGYRITTELASHSSSRTFLGESPSLVEPRRRVVVKLLHTIHFSTEEEQERIFQQIIPLRRLSHRHILPILSAGVYKDMPYLITEYVASGSLDDYLRQRPAEQLLEQEEALSILARIGQALHYAHQRHIVHGNLHPQNVLLNGKGEVLVADFRLHALCSSEAAKNVDTVDTSIYQAPEQLSNHTSVTSDQYALGCIAYELFTGHKAFMIPSVEKPGTYYKTKTLIPPGRFNPSLPSHIEEAILKAMSTEPAQRYPDILAFLTALGPSPIAEDGDQEKITGVSVRLESVTPDAVTYPNLPTVPTSPSPPVPAIDALTAAKMEVPRDSGGRRSLRSSLHKFRVKLTTTRQRVLAVIICLIVTALLVAPLFYAMNSSIPLKSSKTTPSPHTTATVQFLTPTSAPASTPAGPIISHPIPITSQPTQGTIPTPTPTLASAPVPTSALISLTSFLNNEGIGSYPGQANFDGSGYSYPSSQLPPGGQIAVQGVPYQFPSHGQGANDNVVATGQTIPLAAGHYRQAFLLASSSWGPVSGTVTIRYANGSTTAVNLYIPDWLKGGQGGLNTSNRYSSNGVDQNAVHIYVFSITLDSTQTTSALILPRHLSGPYQNGNMHVFAVTLQP